MALKEHTEIVLTAPVTGDGGEQLEPGDVGVIIHIHPGEEAIVAEFFTPDGETEAIATVLPCQMSQVTE